MSLNRFLWLRGLLVAIKRAFLVRVMNMEIHPTVQMSLSVKLDVTFPQGVHIGESTYLAFDVRVLTHDRSRGLYLHTRIGKNCFIGGRSIVLPGVTIGDGCVIGAGSVVTKDIPRASVAAGNPAKVIRSNVMVGAYGRIFDEAELERRLQVAREAKSVARSAN